MHYSESIYLAASKASFPMVLSEVQKGEMMKKLADEYEYKLILPTTRGHSIDTYLDLATIKLALLEPIKYVKDTSKPFKSIITNTVTYVERGYYRYTNLINSHSSILKLFNKKSYNQILELNYKSFGNDIVIEPKLYHKIFLFKHRIRDAKLSNLLIKDSSINKIIDRLDKVLVA